MRHIVVYLSFPNVSALFWTIFSEWWCTIMKLHFDLQTQSSAFVIKHSYLHIRTKPTLNDKSSAFKLNIVIWEKMFQSVHATERSCCGIWKCVGMNVLWEMSYFVSVGRNVTSLLYIIIHWRWLRIELKRLEMINTTRCLIVKFLLLLNLKKQRLYGNFVCTSSNDKISITINSAFKTKIIHKHTVCNLPRYLENHDQLWRPGPFVLLTLRHTLMHYIQYVYRWLDFSVV